MKLVFYVLIFTLNVLQLSMIVAFGKLNVALQLPLPVLTVIFAIAPITGATSSFTSMICTQVFMLVLLHHHSPTSHVRCIIRLHSAVMTSTSVYMLNPLHIIAWLIGYNE